MDSKWGFMKRNKSDKGFTLAELLVTIVIASIVTGLILDNFVRVLTQVKEDREKVTTTITSSGILQQIGDDIKNAGEGVPENTFPVIIFNDEPKNVSTNVYDPWKDKNYEISTVETSRIIIQRAILKPLTLCQNIEINDAIGNEGVDMVANGILVATDNKTISEPGCRTSPLQVDSTMIPILPQILRDVRSYRCKSALVLNPDRLDGCHTSTSLNNSRPVVLALLSNKAGAYHSFDIYNEVVVDSIDNPPISEYKLLVGNEFSPEGAIAKAKYRIGDPIYIIEKREYVLDDKGNINLYVDGMRKSTIAAGIAKFQVSAKLYSNRLQKTIQSSPDNPCTDLSANTCTLDSSSVSQWKDIALINIKIQQKYNPRTNNTLGTSSNLEKLTVSSDFSLNNR
jgi:prepilin-type N-terminal cleavage/methylation domain-containing protein